MVTLWHAWLEHSEERKEYTTTSLGHFWSNFWVFIKIWRSQKQGHQCREHQGEGKHGIQNWTKSNGIQQGVNRVFLQPIQGSWNFAFYTKMYGETCVQVWPCAFTPCGTSQLWISCNFLRGPVCCGQVKTFGSQSNMSHLKLYWSTIVWSVKKEKIYFYQSS